MNKFEKFLIRLSVGINAILFGILMMLMLSSCKTQQPQVVEKIVTNTEYIDRHYYDSVYIDNYVYVDKGADTITITKTNVEYRYKSRVDTFTIEKTDSIPYEVPKIEYVDKMNKHQKTMYWLGWLAVVIVGLRLFWKVYKKFKI